MALWGSIEVFYLVWVCLTSFKKEEKKRKENLGLGMWLKRYSACPASARP
jgi:hypothetical protein